MSRRAEQFGMKVDLTHALAAPDLTARAARLIAGRRERPAGFRQRRRRDQQVEVAQHAPAVIGVEAVEQP